jgi:glycosyltransferase involved in cell wall biosynthesis
VPITQPLTNRQPDPAYSIVIPAYNEAGRIQPTLEQVLAFIAAQRWNAEVLVVNDGSRDRTVSIVENLSRDNPVLRLLENPGNRGKGYSVRNGMMEARGEVLLFSDADLSAPIAEAQKLFDAIAAGADIAIGSRWIRTELQTHRQPLYRQFFGRIYNFALRLILGLNFKDTQCGFKAFRCSAARQIFPLQRIERWGFDPELLFLARRLGLKVVEIPVEWGHSGATRIHPFKDGARMFWDILRIRWQSLSGKYTAPNNENPTPV